MINTQIENLNEKGGLTLEQLTAKKMLADLREEYLTQLEADCVEIGYYEDLGEGYTEKVLFDWVQANLMNIKTMIDALGYKAFEEWFVDYHETEETKPWVREWTRKMSPNFYKLMTELL